MEQTRGFTCITLSLGGYSQFLSHPTWRIISVSKRFTTMVSKSPLNGVVKPRAWNFMLMLQTSTNYKILGMLYETNILGSVYIYVFIYIFIYIYIHRILEFILDTYVFCLAHQLLYVVKKT